MVIQEGQVAQVHLSYPSFLGVRQVLQDQGTQENLVVQLGQWLHQVHLYREHQVDQQVQLDHLCQELRLIRQYQENRPVRVNHHFLLVLGVQIQEVQGVLEVQGFLQLQHLQAALGVQEHQVLHSDQELQEVLVVLQLC